LYGTYFLIKLSFNKVLEVMETLKNFRFTAKQINPSVLAKIINET